ncbi:NAD(P)-dependent oxidoreductase [Nocardia sp. NPDC052278]|uniref:NAD(P)-dependent oxidoreductase n=1 Tax=unclassified Nocardia TaxID=2637762 RepID=UPI0036CFA5D9
MNDSLPHRDRGFEVHTAADAVVGPCSRRSGLGRERLPEYRIRQLMKGRTKLMELGVSLDVPDVLIVDDGHLRANWPYLRDRLRAGLVNHDRTVLFASLDAGQRIRDLYGIAAVPALVVIDVEPDVEDIAALTKLEVVAGVTGGAKLAVADRLAGQGIPFVDGSRGRARSQAEMIVGLMISALRQIPAWHNIVAASGPWPRPSWQFTDHPSYVNGTVCGKQVAVIGMDPVGRTVIGLCAAMGAHVWVVDPAAEESEVQALAARRIRLDEVALIADIVVVAGNADTPPLTAEMVARLASRTLVVTVRGGGIDLAALRARVLADELLWATDVYESVPVAAGDPILGRDNVIHTPAIAACTREANLAVADVLADNIDRVLRGGPPLRWDCVPAFTVDDKPDEPARGPAADEAINGDGATGEQP